MKPFVYKYQTIDPYGHYAWAFKDFNSQKELFRYLVGEKELVLSQRKSINKRADACVFMPLTSTSEICSIEKSLKPVYSNDKEAGILKRTILANTYWWMDSYSDVHIGRGDGDTGIFTESIKNRANKIPPINQHEFNLDGIIGKTIAIYEEQISWRALGVGRTGMTEGLFADAEIHKDKNEKRYSNYLNDEIDQHSVGMRYIDIELAVNDEQEFPKEFKVFQKYIGKIGNRSAVEKQGFFFAVSKANLFEYSAVIAGANELTPTMGVSQGSGDTGKEGEPGGTRKAIDYEYLLKNFKI